MKMPRLWEIVNKFRDLSKSNGWTTSEHEDWVKVGDEYHTFVWARGVHPSSFKRISRNKMAAIREGQSYNVVKISYTAWLLSESPPESVIREVSENPDFSGRIALYDLSGLLDGKSLCRRLNSTDSSVFREFELFLKNDLKAKIKPMEPVSDVSFKTDKFTVAEVA
jgi:hypothetical protein